MSPADIIFVRYCPGSAGNFIISLVQLDPAIAHWNTDFDGRQHQLTDAEYMTWFRQRFRPDLANHLKHEPHHPYQLDFVSAKYPRGDDLTWSEFYQAAQDRDDQHLLQAVDQGRPLVLRLHKSRVPDWAVRSRIINIMADPASHKWLHRTRCTKMFGFENGECIRRESDPEFLKYKYRYTSVRFQNQYRFDQSRFSFMREHVIQEPVVPLFKSASSLLEHASNLDTGPQFQLDLSALFDRDRMMQAVHDLYLHLSLGPPRWSLIKQSYDHYFTTHVQPILVKCKGIDQ